MGGIEALLLMAASVLAIAGAKEMKWKLLNLLIILGFVATGVGIGFLIGIWGGNPAIGGHTVLPLSTLLGAVGGLGCIRRNKWRQNKDRVQI
jgi:hypothetical protein